MKRLLLVTALYLALAGCNDPSKQNKDSMDNKTNNKTVEWAHSTNIYEVNLRQFSAEGSFAAFAKDLPRLKDMGVKTLWFMPITPISQKNKKGSLGSYYACSDYTAINPEFGTLDDFKKLVQQAKAMDFKVIIDWVANHTGWDHRWTVEHPEYFLRDSATGDFKRASGMDDIIELDYSNPALRKAMIDAMIYWVKECDIDGYRCDLASWVEVDFWKEARPIVDSVKHLFWLGEFDEIENPEYGKVFDASYSWKWMHTTREFYQNKLPLAVLDSLLLQYTQIGDSSMRAWFTTNHDENTWNGTEYEKYGDMAKTLAVFSATWNGVPLIYNGQEIPLVTKRLEFFEKDPIPWTGTNELHGFYKTLLSLHSMNPALRGGDANAKTIRIRNSDGHNVMAYLRKNGDREVFVLLNMSPHSGISVQLDDEHLSGSYRDVFSGEQVEINKGKLMSLGAWQYRVFEK
ncbi:MAG: 1,4-alpha-glucan branching protein [Chitinophagaceae bacterium]|nr:MAG: 1,4-alpha-glucan branching protein [Chitinophagaceae bacterium]